MEDFTQTQGLLVSCVEAPSLKNRTGVELFGNHLLSGTLKDLSSRSTAIIGNPDDKGVELNGGRSGASEGPNYIRKYLSKMTLPMEDSASKVGSHFDLGNVKIDTRDIRETHSNTRKVVSAAVGQGARVVCLGGGHDFAFPNIAGFCEGNKGSTIGVINIDPHLDMRPLENGMPHSGSPFRQLLESKCIDGANLVEFGAISHRNGHEHYIFAKKHGVEVQTFEGLCTSGISFVDSFKNTLRSLVSRVDNVFLTIDIDCCSEVEGVSAPPVLGFSALDLYQMVLFATQHRQVSGLEIAETAPCLDFNNRSARLAAELVYRFCVYNPTLLP